MTLLGQAETQRIVMAGTQRFKHAAADFLFSQFMHEEDLSVTRREAGGGGENSMQSKATRPLIDVK